MTTQFTMRRGDSKLLQLSIVDSDGAPINLTGATAIKWGLAKTALGPALVAKSEGNGLTVSSPAQGTIEITIDPTDTSDLDGGEYYHEVEVTDAQGHVATPIGDRCLILPDLLTGD